MKKTITILIFISVVFQIIPFFPWWIYLVPVFVSGAILPLDAWKVFPFRTGFVTGFLVWIISTIGFELYYKGEIMSKMSKIISDSPAAQYLIYILIGLIGGFLTALAFYSGFLLRKGKDPLDLELSKDQDQ